MKTITIKLSKAGHLATLTAFYDDATWPAHFVWAGAREEFRLYDGSLPTLLASEARLEEVVAHQARQSGAAWEIVRHGACPLRTDNVIAPKE